MPHKSKLKKKKGSSIAGSPAGRDLARARARRQGKTAVFSKDEAGREISSEKTPEQVEGKRRFDISEEQEKLKTEKQVTEREASQLTTTTDAQESGGITTPTILGDVTTTAHDEFGNPMPIIPATEEQAQEIRKQEFQNIGQVALLASGATPTAIGRTIQAIKTSGDTIKIAGKSVKRFPLTNEEMITYGKQVIKADKERKGKFGKFGVGGTVLAAIWATNEFILSPSELATWAAVDNVAGVTSFQTKIIVDGVKFDGADPDEAQERIDEAKQTIANARSYVNIATMLNPKMWGPRKQMLTAIDAAQTGVEDNERRLNQIVRR